jgi:hydroxypyruvate reductase
MPPEELLKVMFRAAVDAALPELCVPAHLPPRPKGRTVIIGAGKASGAMAKALEDAWDGPLEGLVVTRYGYRVPTERLEVVEAAHPVPDEAGRKAARRILELVQGLTEDDLVLCLISGGGSALLSMPGEGITFEDKQAVNKALLKSGATISEMNTVRKHLSAIKGGRLAAAAAPARVVALMISDVPGDDPSIIASGPTVPDPSSNEDALGIINKYGIAVPDAVRARLATVEGETPKPGDPCFARVENIMIATPQASLEAAAEVAREAGVTPVILGDSIEGEARDVALVHAAIARQCATRGQPEEPPCVLISGGETTITLKGKGKGGRNTEFLLALAIALQGLPGVYALAGDTDGIDGSEDNAGALVTPHTLARAEAAGLNAKAMLADNDPWNFFNGLGDLLVTGPTLTNVNDFRAILIEKR